MVNDSRSSSKIKDDESNSSKKKLVTSGDGTNDTSSLRRSARETSSSKQMTPSPPSTRKSERLVKQMPVSPLIKKKSERIKKQMTFCPLRRSDRGKKHTSSSFLGSKKSDEASGSSDMKQLKGKREKSLKQLTVEVKEVSRSEDPKPACGKRKKMDARSFKALLMTQRRRKAAAVSDEDVVKTSDKGGIIEETLIDAEKLLVDCSTEEQLQNPELVGSASASMAKSLDDDIELGTGDNATPAKRKRHQMVMDFDASAMDARKDVCTTSSDDVFSSSGCKIHDLSETCVACSKRQRLDHDSRSQDFCSCSTALNKYSNETNVLENKNESLVKLSILPAGSPPGLDNSYLDTLNKLRDFLDKGQSAVVFDDQDRIMKVILFIISLTDLCQPFLIVTSSNSLPLWEAELLRMAPSIDIVLYSGNSNNRSSIRKMKFYDEGGRIMFQVLLSSLEAVVEDLQVFESLKWKAIIVDECQQSRVSTQFEQIKMLATDLKVLLFSGPIKDSVTEYLHLLSLLDCHGDFANIDGPKTESNDNLCKLKERLSQYIACECKSDSSKFVEFWVPSQISNVQLEQYCSTLLSNSISLCLCSKTDPVGALRNILFSTRKCCDHPYIVDPFLKGLITKDLPAVNFLDVGIKAGGKLQLLEVILSEMKKRQLRVLILFQSIGGFGRDSLGLGDILDDFLRERFGPETYERVDGGSISSKLRHTAMNNFNKGSGRFVFLLEKRACLSSIKLSSVDTIIIFDSDWDPANDVKALHKISIDSQFKQIKIFRLYSSCTVEEKVLILAKQGLTLESKLQNKCCSTSNMLLMWGAPYLLNRLDEFHSTSDANISSEQSFLNKVAEEFLALLSQSGENNDIDNPVILKIQQRGGVYCSNLKLLGELQDQLSDGELPHVFWTNLLKGRNPQWKFLSGKTQRHRKKVQYFDKSPKKPEAETVEVGKKCKKVVANCINPANLKPGLEQSEVEVIGGGTSGIPSDNGFCYSNRSDACDAPTVESEESTLPDAQKSLYLLVKPDISKLCEILKLSDEVKLMVGRFLEYVVANHQINNESASILHAFLISLCWSAASLLKQNIDKKESLSLAKHHLNFSCNEEEADCLYSVLRKLKKTFKESILESDFSKDSISIAEDVMKGPLSERVSQSASFNIQNELGLLLQVPNDVLQPKNAQNDKTDEEDTQKSFKRIQRKCKKRIAKFLQKQQEETEEFHRDWEKRRAEFDNKYRVESAITREMYSHKPLRIDKLKVLNSKHEKKMEEHARLKETALKQLGAKQNDERNKIACWLKSARSSAIEDRGQDELTLHGSEFESQVEYSQASEHRSHTVSENDATVSSHLIEEQSLDGIADNKHVNGIMPADNCIAVPNRVVGCNSHNETVGTAVNPNFKIDVLENMTSFARSQRPNGIWSSVIVSEDNVSTSQCHSGKQIADGILLSGPGEMTPPELPESIAEEVMGMVDSVEIGTPGVVSNGEIDRRDAVCSETPNVVENHSQNGEANSSISGDSPSTELSLLKLPFGQPAPSPACDSSLSQNLVLPHDCSQTPLSSNIRDEGLRVEVPSLHPVDTEQIDQSNHDSPLAVPLEHFEPPLEHIEQPQPPLSTNSPLDHNQPDVPPARGSGDVTVTGGHTTKSTEVSFQLLEVPSELSDRAVSLPVVNVDLLPPIDDMEIPLAHNQCDLRSADRNDHQSSGDLNSSFHIDEAPSQVVEHTAELPNPVIPHVGANVELYPPIQSTGIPLPQNQRDVPSASRLDFQPYSEALPDVEGTAELPNQVIFHTGVNVSPIQGFNNHLLHSEHQVPSRIPSLASYGDPLQNELERIGKETEQAIKVHEDMKLGLKSELEEIIAQLCREYEAKLKDAESAFLLKKNELDVNHNKVLMNKILADAFRSKCLDIGPSRPMAMQQGVPPGFAQHLNQSPLHPTPRSSPTTVSSPVGQSAAIQQNTAALLQPGSRLSPVTVSISTGQPAANLHNMAPQLQPVPMVSPVFVSSSGGLPASSQQTATPPLQPASRLYPVTVSSSTGQPVVSQQNTALQLQPAPRVSPISVSSSARQPAASRQNTAVQLQPAPRVLPISVSSSAGQPAASQQSTAPPLQIVHQSAALFSSTSTRPPQINPITPLTGNLRVGSEIRAPAPHLQPFRSASAPAVNFTSLPRVMPSHLTPNSLPTTSHSLPQAPPCPRAAPVSLNYSGSVYDRSPQSITASGLSVPGLSSPINSSPSCLDLITDIHKQHGAQRPNDFPPLPDLGSKLDSLDLSVFENGVSMRVSSPPAAVTTSVVCLSDDD